jgi:hypothetical protein
VEEVSILAGGGDGEDILERLDIGISSREGFNLDPNQRLFQCEGTDPYHLDRGISQVNEGRRHLAILTRSVQGSRIPQRQHSAHQLRKALCPIAVCIRLAIYKGS